MVILLVSSTFLVQNNYYSSQTQRTGAHDNARASTELVAIEIRSTMEDGVVVAGKRTLTIRSPIVLGIICNRDGGQDGDIHTEGEVDGWEVAGIAVRNDTTGAWTYAYGDWDYISQSSGGGGRGRGRGRGRGGLSADRCADNGADTAGAASEFHEIGHLGDLFSPAPFAGEVVMLFRETTFKIQTSELDPATLGLFRGVYGESLVEFATGMDSTAQFQYRTGGSTYADTVSATALGDIDFVRIVADTRKHAQTGGRDDITFGWSVNVALRNVR